MGTGLYPYAVDWERITTIYGCRDERLLGVDPVVDEIVLGKPLDQAARHTYYYALERICSALGNSLPNERLDRINANALSDIDDGMQQIGASGFAFVSDTASDQRLLPLPRANEFPGVTVFPPEVCARARAALDAGLDVLEDDARFSIEEIAGWLDERLDHEGIVVFSY